MLFIGLKNGTFSLLLTCKKKKKDWATAYDQFEFYKSVCFFLKHILYFLSADQLIH